MDESKTAATQALQRGWDFCFVSTAPASLLLSTLNSSRLLAPAAKIAKKIRDDAPEAMEVTVESLTLGTAAPELSNFQVALFVSLPPHLAAACPRPSCLTPPA